MWCIFSDAVHIHLSLRTLVQQLISTVSVSSHLIKMLPGRRIFCSGRSLPMNKTDDPITIPVLQPAPEFSLDTLQLAGKMLSSCQFHLDCLLTAPTVSDLYRHSYRENKNKLKLRATSHVNSSVAFPSWPWTHRDLELWPSDPKSEAFVVVPNVQMYTNIYIKKRKEKPKQWTTIQ